MCDYLFQQPKTVLMMVSMVIKALIIVLMACAACHASLNPKNESKINMGYGILYDYWGRLLHNLDIQELVVSVKLPTFNISATSRLDQFVDLKSHCSTVNENLTDLIDICYYVWPLFQHYRELEEYYVYQIDKKLRGDVARMLPGYVPQEDMIKKRPRFFHDPDPLKGLKEKETHHLERLRMLANATSRRGLEKMSLINERQNIMLCRLLNLVAGAGRCDEANAVTRIDNFNEFMGILNSPDTSKRVKREVEVKYNCTNATGCYELVKEVVHLSSPRMGEKDVRGKVQSAVAMENTENQPTLSPTPRNLLSTITTKMMEGLESVTEELSTTSTTQ